MREPTRGRCVDAFSRGDACIFCTLAPNPLRATLPTTPPAHACGRTPRLGRTPPARPPARLQYVAERQLRGTFRAGHLLEGAGWSIPVAAFNYSAVTCTGNPYCITGRSFARPVDGVALPPTVLSDFTYVGDWPDNSTPGNAYLSASYPAAGLQALPADSTPYLIATELTTPRMRAIMSGDELYITPSLYAVAALYDKEAQAAIANFITFIVIFTPAYMSAYLLLILFSFVPNVRRTNSDIVTKRSMLLFLPAALVARTPSIKALIDDILARDSKAGGGGGDEGGRVGSRRGA